MCEQGGLPGAKPVEPVPSAHLMASKAFVLALRPANQETVQGPQRPVKRGGIEAPVVTNPAEQYRSSPLSEILQGKIVAQMQLPATNTVPHRLGRVGADRRGETDEQPAVAGHRPPGPKRVAQEIESLFRVVVAPVGILAVHDLGLVRVQLELACVFQSIVDVNFRAIVDGDFR